MDDALVMISFVILLVGIAFGVAIGQGAARSMHCKALGAEEYTMQDGRIVCVKVSKAAVTP